LRHSAACAQVDAQLSQKNERVVHRLLSAMCDAVVHIDHNLVIQQPSPKLVALLLKPPSTKGLVGTLLTDLLPPEERDRFTLELAKDVEALSEPLKPGDPIVELACSIPCKMRDASGNKMAVHFFHAAFENLSGLPCHVVGIQEDAAVERLAPLATATGHTANQSNGANEHRRNETRNELRLLEADDSDRLAEDSVSRDGSSFSVEADFSRTFVWIDVNTPQLKVLKCNRSFATLCGPANHCAELMPWVSKRQRCNFKAWLETCSNMLLYGEDEELEHTCFKHLKLYPQHLKGHKVWLMADVHVLPEPEEESEEWNTSLQIELCNLEWLGGRATQGRSHKRGGSDFVISEQAVSDTGGPQLACSALERPPNLSHAGLRCTL